MANDSKGSSTKCPKCKTAYLTLAVIDRRLYYYCDCGYGKKEYLEAAEKYKNSIK